MSRQVVKTSNAGHSHAQVPQRIAHNLQKYSQSALPQVREVNVPAVAQENAVITTYRDLDQPARDFAINQKRQLIIGVFTFVVLGIGIMMGQHFSGKGSANQNRSIASESSSNLVPADASINSSVQYEKTCFTESNGAQVCTTRVSTKRQ
ncbi:MAG: hypothetical protein K0R29_313 [Pseudobdellovibrio sp.]|nr:hypothetical protein [Pseudobdellovibrio sp.]